MKKTNFLIYGVIGGITFGICLVFLNYMKYKTLDLIWLLGGVIWFLSSIFISHLLNSDH